MTTFEVGTKLVALCNQGKGLDAFDTLYAADIVSVEAFAPQGSPETKGLDAVKGKNKWWVDNHQVHSAQALGPFPNGDRFAVFFKYDITQKASGKRFVMEEVALYKVKNGKVVHEEFFYKGM